MRHQRSQKNFALAAVISCGCTAFFNPVAASAITVDVTVTYSAVVDGQGFSNETFSGDASFSFDASGLPSSGFVSFQDIALSSFNLTPTTIGSTTFDATNSRANVAFFDGSLAQITVHGLALGDSTSSSFLVTNDDFQLGANFFVDGAGELQESIASRFFLISAAGFGLDDGANGADVDLDFQITGLPVVPEPASAWLIALGFGAIAARRVRRG